MNSKIALPFLLIIMIGAIGFSYAWWTESLNINGNAQTGELKMVLMDLYCKDGYWQGTPGGTGSWQNEPINTGVATIQQVNDHTIRITMENAYPGYIADFHFRMKNVGSIPAKMKNAYITNIVDPNGLLNYVWVDRCYTFYKTDPAQPSQSALHLSDKSLTDIAPAIYNAYKDKVFLPGGYIYFACDEEGAENSFWLVILEGAPEGASLSFDLVFEWTQFNA